MWELLRFRDRDSKGPDHRAFGANTFEDILNWVSFNCCRYSSCISNTASCLGGKLTGMGLALIAPKDRPKVPSLDVVIAQERLVKLSSPSVAIVG